MKVSIYQNLGIRCQLNLPPHAHSPSRSQKGGNYDTAEFYTHLSEESDFVRTLSQHLTTQVLEAPDSKQQCIPNDRLEELSRQIAEGTYHPDPWQIAGKLLEME